MATFTEIGIAKVDFADLVLDALPGIFIKSIKAKQVWKTNTVDNSEGAWAGEDARDEYIEMDVDFTLTASTKALAAANGAFTLPLAGVAASGGLLGWMNTTGVGGRYTGNWCYHKGGDRSLSPDKSGEGTISLRKFADPTQNAQQFVTPS